ncbi:MAG: DUF2851 family protein [Phocaeicola sp.]
MEQLLHYTWKHKLFPLRELVTTTSQQLEVIDTGIHNSDAGPDFFNAKIKLDGIVWVGNIEIHQRTSDWYRHGHDKDPAYQSVVLHIVNEVDGILYHATGQPIPQLSLTVPQRVVENYQALLKEESYPVCHRIIKKLSKLTLHSWFSSLQMERFEQKSLQLKERVMRCNGDWEEALFRTLARNLGFGVNSDAFEWWAQQIPFKVIGKIRDELFKIEALFLGQAGLLQERLSSSLHSNTTALGNDTYWLKLQKEYTYQQRLFNLQPMEVARWRFLRLRPTNFPHIRLAQLAQLYAHSYGMVSQLIEAETIPQIDNLLKSGTSDYWKRHYTFGEESPFKEKQFSQSTRSLLFINSVIPFLYSYGLYRGNELLCIRATELLEKLKPESNYITRMWQTCGITAAHAGDSQALIQLKKEYCDKKKCLYCRIGYEYLKRELPKNDNLQ